MIGGHLIKHWASTQKTIALSSGEAELSGILKGASEGLGAQSLAKDLGLELDLIIGLTLQPPLGFANGTDSEKFGISQWATCGPSRGSGKVTSGSSSAQVITTLGTC